MTDNSIYVIAMTSLLIAIFTALTLDSVYRSKSDIALAKTGLEQCIETHNSVTYTVWVRDCKEYKQIK